MKNIKSALFVLFVPVLLMTAFHTRVVGQKDVSRAPAVIKEEMKKSNFKSNVEGFILAQHRGY